MILAELALCHSRPIAPTRRVALGDCRLPVDPAPGHGGVLLGAVVARFAVDLAPDMVPDLLSLTRELEAGYRIPQPRLRHRFQEDRIGLTVSRHRLRRIDGRMELDFDLEKGAPAQHVLGAVYAAGRLDRPARGVVFDVIRRGLRWRGPVGPALLTNLAAGADVAGMLDEAALADPVSWALEVLGFATAGAPARSEVQRRFRNLLREAHPDHGAAEVDAAGRIAALTEARRILLSGA